MNTVTVDVRELPGRLGELLTMTEAGTEVVVRDGAAAAKLVNATVPSPPAGKRDWKLGLHPGAMVMREDFNEPLDEDSWEDG